MATATRNVDNLPPSTQQTFQSTTTLANTTAGEGFYGSDIITYETNMQLSTPKIVDGVTVVINGDTGNYLVDKTEMAAAGNSIVVRADYWSPSTLKRSFANVTITAPIESDGDEKAILSTVVSPIMFTLLN